MGNPLDFLPGASVGVDNAALKRYRTYPNAIAFNAEQNRLRKRGSVEKPIINALIQAADEKGMDYIGLAPGGEFRDRQIRLDVGAGLEPPDGIELAQWFAPPTTMEQCDAAVEMMRRKDVDFTPFVKKTLHEHPDWAWGGRELRFVMKGEYDA